MNAPDAELKRLIEAKSAAVTAAALRDGGNVSQADVDDLDRLTRLLELQAPSAATVFQRRWHMAVLLVGTLIAVSVLLFARVRETAIELEIDATQVSFELASRQVLLEHVSLERLGASGFERIDLPELPDGGEGDAENLQAIAVAAAGDGAGRGSVDLTHVAPAEGTRVTIAHAEVAKEYRLSLIDPHFEVNVGVQGPVRLSSLGGEPVDFRNPRAVKLAATTGVVDLDLLFRDVDQSGIIPQIPVRNLMFARVVDHSADVSVTRRLSTINRGTLYFESLNGTERALRTGEALRFREAHGEIRALKLGNDQLVLNFQGRVRGMVTGSLDHPQDLMPTWLEWLKAQHGLSLLWGSTFYLFGLALTIGRWLKGAA
jgi:hypothetical protein